MKKYYLYSDTFGLIEYVENEPGFIYNIKLDKSYRLTDEYSESPDEAKLKYFLKQIGYYKEKSASLNKQIEKVEKYKSKLYSEFGYLIEIFPEEFL